jgi:hypothetical protein
MNLPMRFRDRARIRDDAYLGDRDAAALELELEDPLDRRWHVEAGASSSRDPHGHVIAVQVHFVVDIGHNLKLNPGARRVAQLLNAARRLSALDLDRGDLGFGRPLSPFFRILALGPV